MNTHKGMPMGGIEKKSNQLFPKNIATKIVE